MLKGKRKVSQKCTASFLPSFCANNTTKMELAEGLNNSTSRRSFGTKLHKPSMWNNNNNEIQRRKTGCEEKKNEKKSSAINENNLPYQAATSSSDSSSKEN